MTASFLADCSEIRRKNPLILCITNYVAMEFNADALLAVGASPLMSLNENEMEQLALRCSALYVNIGCPDRHVIAAAEKAVRSVALSGKPWVLDPVGVGVTSLRNAAALNLMHIYHPSVIRGNASEISALAGENSLSSGLESAVAVDEAQKAAVSLASDIHGTVVVSGPSDYVTDGHRTVRIHNGSPLMRYVTGAGCTASALCAAFLAVDNDTFTAAWGAMEMIGCAGQLAAEKCSGSGSLKAGIVDELCNCAPEAYVPILQYETD